MDFSTRTLPLSCRQTQYAHFAGNKFVNKQGIFTFFFIINLFPISHSFRTNYTKAKEGNRIVSSANVSLLACL